RAAGWAAVIVGVGLLYSDARVGLQIVRDDVPGLL
ncbi:MAG: hypothetical protein ACI8S6_002971, partial [Myxococcota bacterium]